mmetsp:Transcript_130243/g.253685  ORF Transcript_130243/g.253685 Transcript_130243/m.253685 type:complete len:253 (-) Transcript_130243:197-955(-)
MLRPAIGGPAVPAAHLLHRGTCDLASRLLGRSRWLVLPAAVQAQEAHAHPRASQFGVCRRDLLQLLPRQTRRGSQLRRHQTGHAGSCVIQWCPLCPCTRSGQERQRRFGRCLRHHSQHRLQPQALPAMAPPLRSAQAPRRLLRVHHPNMPDHLAGPRCGRGMTRTTPTVLLDKTSLAWQVYHMNCQDWRLHHMSRRLRSMESPQTPGPGRSACLLHHGRHPEKRGVRLCQPLGWQRHRSRLAGPRWYGHRMR